MNNLNKIIAIIENVIKLILSTWDKVTEVQIKNVELLYKEDKFNILGKGSFEKAKVTIKAVSGEYPFQITDDYIFEISLYDYSILQKNLDVYQFGKNGIKLEDMHPIQQEEYVKCIADGIKRYYGIKEAMEYLHGYDVIKNKNLA